jgi:hypothetical protein
METHGAVVVKLSAWRGRAQARSAALMWGAKARTVAIPGDVVSPDATLRSVWKGTPESLASLCSCETFSGDSAARTSSGLGTVSFIGKHPTGIGSSCLPVSVALREYPNAPMTETAAKAIVAANVEVLVTRKYGRVNITAFGRDAKIGTGGAQRLLDHETSVGVDLIARAAAFFDMDPWQLLAPNLGQALVLSPAELAKVKEMREPQQPKGIIPAEGAKSTRGMDTKKVASPLSTPKATKKRGAA